MKTGALLLSLAMCAVGLALAFVYWNPWGFVLDGIGFMLFLYAISGERNEIENYPSRILEPRIYRDYRKEIDPENYRCRICANFEKSECKRQEKLLNAKPCEDFKLR
jgi:hypothetical protein